MNPDEMEQLKKTLDNFYAKLQFKEAINMVSKYDDDNDLNANIKASVFIDAGFAIRNQEIIKKGIVILEQLLKQNKIDKLTVLYNLANGYSNLANIEYTKPEEVYFNRDNYFQKAKKYYQESLSFSNITTSMSAELLINYGNCLNTIGRTLEALEAFENALKIDSDHPMALGNKGIALVSYTDIIPEYHLTHLKEAQFYLEKALKNNPPPESIAYFTNYLDIINHTFPDLKKSSDYPGYSLEIHSNLEKFLVNFCLEHKLFLNPCNFCQKCDVCLGDNALIDKMMIDNRDQKYDINSDPFFVLSSYLNQIKQDFISARFLLVLSQYDDFDINFIDKNVRKIRTPDRSINNIYVQLLKFAFKNLYDVLDKIACFIDYYLDLQIKQNKIYFSSIWYDKKTKKVLEEITNTNNPALNALYDIHNDLSFGRYREFTQHRHKLTHRFLNVSRYKEENNKLSLNQFYIDTVTLAKITKNAILYTLFFVNIEENKKPDNNYIKITPDVI